MNESQKNTILISILIIIGSFAFVYMVLLNPRKEAVEQKQVLATEISAKTERLKTINDLRPILPDIDKKIGQITSIALPKGEQVPDIIEQVEQVLLSVGDFTVVSFNPSLGGSTQVSAESANGLTQSTFTVSVKGDVTKLSSLFDAINTNMRPLFINTVSIVPDSDITAKPNQVIATLSMYTVSVPSAAAVAGSASEGGTSEQ